MSSPPTSRPSSPSHVSRSRSGSFRSSSPTHPIQIEHQIPNHPHLHIHTIRSPVSSPPNNADGNVHEDDFSPPSSISAQILAPFLNAPVPSLFKTPNQPSNGQSRGANARATALGSLSRSSSQKRGSRRRSDEETSLAKEYLTLLGTEHMDPERLSQIRSLASERGIPHHLRKYVWPLLLSQFIREVRLTDGVAEDDTDDRLSKLAKRIRAELSRHHRRSNRRALPQSSSVSPSAQTTTPPQEPSVPSATSSNASSPTGSPPQAFLDNAPVDLAVESTILTFLTTNPHIEYAPGMVYLALTLAMWIFYPSVSPCLPGYDDPNILLRDAFAGALSLFGQLPTPCPIRSSRQNSTVSLTSVLPTEAAKYPATHRISQFLSAFRLVMPELASYFDDEGVGGWGDDWVGGWVGWFCAKELSGKINDEAKARLWDVYFSYPVTPSSSDEEESGPGEDLHIYVCIALLKSCADALEVLEQSEIRTLLQQLPPVEDVESILKEAKRIKEKALLAEKEEEEGYIARKSSGGSRSGSEKGS